MAPPTGTSLTNSRWTARAPLAASQCGRGGRVTVDTSTGTIGFTLDGATVLWRDWRFDEQGRIVGWSIDLGKVTLPIE